MGGFEKFGMLTENAICLHQWHTATSTTLHAMCSARAWAVVFMSRLGFFSESAKYSSMLLMASSGSIFFTFQCSGANSLFLQ